VGFGSNPGQLRASIYVPESAGREAPLVVVLHGCTQSAAGYDESSGWSRLAEQHGFAVLYPEQQVSNNANLCFNWFLAADATRGSGEALSIRQMITAAQVRFGTDSRRVFVTGLSAGGAMAAAMLSTYPDVFAGGAVIAGLPFGVARTIPEAFDRMRGHGGPPPSELANLVRGASGQSNDWPTLSVWHGDADLTVDPSNAAALVEQWRPLHGVEPAPTTVDKLQGFSRRAWANANGREVIEQYSITGLGHGTPLDTRGSDHGESIAPFMLEAGISSTRLIARHWGIVADQPAVQGSRAPAPPMIESVPPMSTPKGTAQPAQTTIGQTIEDALRRAGLMK
jgi:poly(hydroxyalkanoate) depolymerase family esterase